jgi:hypothetical protein
VLSQPQQALTSKKQRKEEDTNKKLDEVIFKCSIQGMAAPCLDFIPNFKQMIELMSRTRERCVTAPTQVK